MKKKKSNKEVMVPAIDFSNLNDLHFLWAIDDLSERVFQNAKDKGFWDDERNDGELIALMHSELSEMLEALRKDPKAKDEKCPDFTNLEIEAADVFIRLLDYCAGRKLRLGDAVLAKHKYNTTRPKKHGKRF